MSGSHEVVIEVQGLRKSYGFKPVLRRLDLTLYAGQSMALLGSNGAGKTTLLRILAGLGKPGAGTVTIHGCDVRRDAQQIRQYIGFVGHQPYLYEELTALENLLFFGRMYNVEHASGRARHLLDCVGMGAYTHQRVGALSRGQVQRIAWARALLHNPRVLLLDEAETGMDQSGYELIAELLINHTQQGGATLFTTHHLDQALNLSDHIVMLAAGRVVFAHETAGLTLPALQRVYREVSK